MGFLFSKEFQTNSIQITNPINQEEQAIKEINKIINSAKEREHQKFISKFNK